MSKDWFSALGAKAQKAYLAAHPNSKKRKRMSLIDKHVMPDTKAGRKGLSRRIKWQSLDREVRKVGPNVARLRKTIRTPR